MYFQSTLASLRLLSSAPGMEVGVRAGRQKGDICVEGSCLRGMEHAVRSSVKELFSSVFRVYRGLLGPLRG